MAVFETWVNRDLKKIMTAEDIRGTVFTLDNLGNLIGVRVFSDGEPVTLSGTVNGYCILADGTTVPVSGYKSENRAWINLPQSAYAVPGMIRIAIKLTEDSAITTLAALIGSVALSRTDNMITPSSQVITDWSQQIAAEMQAVEDASEAQDAKIADIRNVIVNKEQNTDGELFGTEAIFTVIPGMLNGSMKWTTGSNASHISIPINAGDTIKITANNSAKAQYAFLKSDFVDDGQTSDYVEDTTRYDITKGTSSTFTAPSGAEYLYILSYYNNLDYYPAGIVINGVNRLESISEKIRAKYNEMPVLDKNNVVNEIASSTDINTITSPGNYTIKNSATAQSLTHYPSTVGGRLTVFTTDNSNRIHQFVFDANEECYLRYYGSSAWTDWIHFASLDGAVKLSNQGNPEIGSNEDFNTYTTIGNYYVLSSGRAKTISNCPSIYGGRLFVFQLSYAIEQFYISDVNTIYYRNYLTSTQTWSDWAEMASVNQGGIGGKVVDLFMFMGQSNMAGRGATSQTWPETAPTVKSGTGYEFRAISDPSKLYDIAEPFGVNENKSGGISEGTKTGSMVAAFANKYYELTGIPVVGVSASQGSTTTNDWLPTGTLLPDAIDRFEDAVTFLTTNGYTIRHKFMCWCQGESDNTRGISKENFKTRTNTIFEAMFTAGIEKIFICRTGKYVGIDEEQNPMRIMEAQTEIAETDKRVMLAITNNYTFLDRGLLKDDFHYYQAGYNEMGRVAATNVASYVNNQIEPVMYDPMTEELYYPKKLQ